MKANTSYRLINSLSVVGFIAAMQLVLFAFRVGDAGVRAEAVKFFLAGGAVLLVLHNLLTSSFARLFRSNYNELRAAGEPAFLSALNRLGEAPLLGLILLLGQSLLLLAAAHIFQTAFLRVESAVSLALLAFCLGLAMFAGAFQYIISDRLVLNFLRRQNLSQYPPSLRSDRQAKKMFIIPFFLCIMTLFFALFFLILLGFGAPADALGKPDRIFAYFAGGFLPFGGLYMLIVGLLMLLWNHNTSFLLRTVTDQLDKILSQEKDLSGRINVASIDELATISGSVNRFCDMLAQSIIQIRSIYGELNGLQARLFESIRISSNGVAGMGEKIESAIKVVEREDATVGSSLESAGALSGNIDGMLAKVSAQAASVSDSAARVERMLASISEVTRNTQDVRAKADQLVESFRRGEENIQATIATVNRVSEQSELLLEINTLISGVASKTNLLAMNAAIEAAHAGDAGRGFAVVADEIRNLAEATAKNTKASKESLKKVVEDIKSALKVSEETGAAFAKIKQVIDEVNLVIASIAEAMGREERENKEIHHGLTATISLTRELEGVARALGGLSSAMMGKLRDLGQRSKEAMTLSTEMRAGNADIRANLNQLDSLSNQTATLTGHLKDLLEEFKT